MKITRRKKKIRVEDFSVPKINDSLILDISKSLAKQIDKKEFEKKYATVKNVLTLVGAGAFLVASLAAPNLPRALKPLLKDQNEYEAWKRFNIPYLKRTLYRLEQQKMVEIAEEKSVQIIKITDSGNRRILRYAMEELSIERPRLWDGKWRLVSYDIPGDLKALRKMFRERLCLWGFFPLHESVLLHAYPCEKQVEFLREYLGMGEFVRIFSVSKIENDARFRDFFGV